MAVGVCSGPAATIQDANGDAVGRAAGVATEFVNGVPLIIVTLVEDGRQTTMAMDLDQSNHFCDMLADAVYWQTAALAPASGKPN
ncbi:hypothetical protein IP68_04790 [Blastomonas sp. AAP25]|nr:hypothetical protein IP68_04790 [Blastomonas sp. AAP25]